MGSKCPFNPDSIIASGNNAIRYGELYTKYDFKIDKIYSFIPDEAALKSKKINTEDIVFTGSGETIDEIGKSAAYMLKEPCFAGGDTIVFSPKNQSSLYLAFLLNIGSVRKQLRAFGQGQSVVHIYKKDIENISIFLPPQQIVHSFLKHIIYIL